MKRKNDQDSFENQIMLDELPGVITTAGKIKHLEIPITRIEFKRKIKDNKNELWFRYQECNYLS